MFIHKSRELCKAIKKSKIPIFQQSVKVNYPIQQGGNPQPQLCIEIQIPTDDVREQILKLGEKNDVLETELVIIVVQDYKHPVAACSPGVKVGKGTIGCFVRSEQKPDIIMCITCYHCIGDGAIELHSINGIKEGTYKCGQLDHKNDICVITLKENKCVSNLFPCGHSPIEHRPSKAMSSLDNLAPLSDICKFGATTKKSCMVVLEHIQSIEYELDNVKYEACDVVALGIDTEACKLNRNEIFDCGDSGSVGITCGSEKECFVAGILFAKYEEPSGGRYDKIALMHPLDCYFESKKLKLI